MLVETGEVEGSESESKEAPWSSRRERILRTFPGKPQATGTVQAYLPSDEKDQSVEINGVVHGSASDGGDHGIVDAVVTEESGVRCNQVTPERRDDRPSREVQAESIRRCASLFLGKDISRETVMELLDEAYMSTADDYGLDEAI
jgi:hypothetical protein